MSGPEPRAGQEAARLVLAAQEWLRTSAPHLAPLAEDGEPCSCPLCRAVVGLREADPDSVGRWVDTALAAVGSVMTQAADLARPGAADADEPADTDGGEGDTTADGYLDTEDDALAWLEGQAVEDDLDEDDPDEDDVAEGTPTEDAARHDGSRRHGVRRIPLDPDPGAARET